MKATTLRVKTAPRFRVDASKLLPAALAKLSLDELQRLSLKDLTLGDVFDITQSEAQSPSLHIEGDASWLDRLAADMTEGTLTVRGNAGDYAGIHMSGGELRIHGNAGLFTACELRGGRVVVHGHTGDFAAAALPGDMEGMSGGVLTIHGNAGARLADRMRRGLVLVAGDAGDFAASRLIAGSVCIGGKSGAHLGYGMRRGTVLLMQPPSQMVPTFTEGGHGFEVFWRLFTRTLAREQLAPFATLAANALPTRYAGDLAVDGRGELLIAKR